MTDTKISYKQLVIVSGKGGTGKTSLTASFAQLNRLASIETVLVDADVDASNLELLLEPEHPVSHDFFAGVKASIDPETCQACGRCAEVCRFSAITSHLSSAAPQHEIYSVNALACEGCAACQVVCPYQAIQMQTQQAGIWLKSQTNYGALFHASLFPGQENSGKLVTLIRQQARLSAQQEGQQMILIDGPPGIGCPVISAFAGVDLALIVTEATLSGMHDLDRILKTVQHFKLNALICINKADLYPEGAEAIERYAQQEGIAVVGQIPYDPMFMQAVISGKPLGQIAEGTPALHAIQAVWEHTLSILQGDNHDGC